MVLTRFWQIVIVTTEVELAGRQTAEGKDKWEHHHLLLTREVFFSIHFAHVPQHRTTSSLFPPPRQSLLVPPLLCDSQSTWPPPMLFPLTRILSSAFTYRILIPPNYHILRAAASDLSDWGQPYQALLKSNGTLLKSTYCEGHHIYLSDYLVDTVSTLQCDILCLQGPQLFLLVPL